MKMVVACSSFSQHKFGVVDDDCCYYDTGWTDDDENGF